MRLKVSRSVLAAFLAAVLLLACGSAAAEKTITITFTGDMTLGCKDNERNYEDCFDNVVKKKGYDYFLADFKEMFKKDDLTVINLEGPLTDITANRIQKNHPMRGSTDFVKILTRSGIDAASLSNNHIGDYGAQGENNTKKTLDDSKIKWFTEFNYYMFEKDGIRIALFGLTNSVLNKQRPKFIKAIQDARDKDGADAVIVCWHTGTEYKGTHDAYAETGARLLIRDAGINLFIINHPHVALGTAVFNNSTVFYALGNFVFGGNRTIRAGKDSKDPYAISLYGMVVQAKLTFTDGGRYLGQQMNVYPVFSSSSRPDYKVGEGWPPNVSDRALYPNGEVFVNDYRPMRLTVAQAADVYECIRRDSSIEVPAMKEKDGFAVIEFPYLPSADTAEAAAAPEAAKPKPSRNNKGK